MSNKTFSIYDEKYLSEDDKKFLTDVKRRATLGETDWDSAHALFEQTRAKYGYSGGDDGSQYIRIDSGSPDSFGRVETPAYSSPYQKNVDSLVHSLLNQKEFKYDHTKDPAYLELEKAYTKGAQRAMDDTLGKVSARTGGIASSYAGQVAQDTYNDYMDDLSDKVTALRESAYQKYLDDKEATRADLNTLLGLDETAYNRYLNEQSLRRSDNSFNYGVYRDEQADKTAADAAKLNEAKLRAQYGDLSGLKALGFDTSEYEKSLLNSENSAKFNEELSLALTYAQYGDFSKLKALGIDTTAYEQNLAAQQAANLYKAYASPVTEKQPSTPKLSFSEAKEAAENGILDENVISVLRENGYTDEMLRVYYNYTPEGENVVPAPPQMYPSQGYSSEWMKNLPGTSPNTQDVSQEFPASYNGLSNDAKLILSNIQAAQSRRGNAKGLTQEEINNLLYYVENGWISEEDLDKMLYILGV